jgi:hypothetical protein
MAVAEVELTIEGRESEALRSRRPRDRYRSLVIFGRPTETNCGLAAAFAGLGHRAQLAGTAAAPASSGGDLAIARLDVLLTLDGIEPGALGLRRLERQGCRSRRHPLYAAA